MAHLDPLMGHPLTPHGPPHNPSWTTEGLLINPPQPFPNTFNFESPFFNTCKGPPTPPVSPLHFSWVTSPFPSLCLRHILDSALRRCAVKLLIYCFFSGQRTGFSMATISFAYCSYYKKGNVNRNKEFAGSCLTN